MIERDKKIFALLMKRLKVTFPSNITAQDEALRTEIYWEQFKGCSIESFAEAVNMAISNCSFFPKPSELHEHIRLIGEVKYTEKLTESSKYLLEDKTKDMTPDEAKECLRKICEMIKIKPIGPTLEGKEAEEFELKRQIAKEKAKELN